MKIKSIVTTAIVSAFLIGTVPHISAAETKSPAKEEKKEAVKPYKLDTCLVSDEKLGEMGDAVVFTHEGQEIKLCCKKCKPKFEKNPAPYLKKLEGK